MLDIRPQVFVGVPRVWEKFQTGIQLAIAAEADAGHRALAEQAIAVGRQITEHEQRGETPPADLLAASERLAPVRRMILGRIGLDECRIAYTSTAPTPLDVLLFFAGLDLPIYEVWGMSELTGPATSNRVGAARYGTVGVTLPGVEARLAEDGELLVRGGNVMPGYYKDAERTAEAFGPDGWLRTGDLAAVDEAGYYRIVDRKKDLLITSYGKNIAPSSVEALLKHHPLIGQAMAVGDARPYVCALLVLDHEALGGWARAHGLTGAPEELATHPAVVEEVRRAVASANAHLSHPEQVKRFLILPAEWTPTSEELTPTLKLRRRIILHKYADAIASLYAEPPGGYAAEAAAVQTAYERAAD
jgi:long-subunit acyl-CoA synthetase (AMP-forming)